MKSKQKNVDPKTAYNVAVMAAYQSILKKTKIMLSSIEDEEPRFTLEREFITDIKPNTVLHELVTPLLYLRLACEEDGFSNIHFGMEQKFKQSYLHELTSTFIRMIFTVTAKEATAYNIEGAVHTDWIINECADLYEYVDINNKHHTAGQIVYVPVKRATKKVSIKVA